MDAKKLHELAVVGMKEAEQWFATFGRQVMVSVQEKGGRYRIEVVIYGLNRKLENLPARFNRTPCHVTAR